VTTLDVSSLTTNVNANVFGSVWNGIIYVVDTSAGANGMNAKRAIRLKNGGSLPDGGLTVVSANPVYVQGDYNTGTTSTTQPASNNASSPIRPNRPCPATLASQLRLLRIAVTILSNAWLDSKAGTVPTASRLRSTPASFLASSPVAMATHSGGVENFPRFLENWSGQNLYLLRLNDRAL
jgi:hypothetical protein